MIRAGSRPAEAALSMAGGHVAVAIKEHGDA
jgi:hypothetical protein